MSTKVNRLTPANMSALREIGAEGEGAQFGETYVVFAADPETALTWVQEQMDDLPNRTAHPYASLHAVVRKLKAQVIDESATDHATPSDNGQFRPDPGEQFQIWKGLGHDDDVYRVIEYAPVTAPPEKVMVLYHLDRLPTEAVHAWRLEKVASGGRGKELVWKGVAFTAFPIDIMQPVGGPMRAPSKPGAVPMRILTQAAQRLRIAEIDAEFDEKLGRLLAEHDVNDALDLPREIWHPLQTWRAEQYAIAHGRDPKSRELVNAAGRPTRRSAGDSRPTSGACEHCGLPTKGGKFVPGHDAKLKGDLGRAAADGETQARVEAMAEATLRSKVNAKWAVPVPPELQAQVDELVASGDEFMARRIAARRESAP